MSIVTPSFTRLAPIPILSRLLQEVVLTFSMMILVLSSGDTVARLHSFGLTMQWFWPQVSLRHKKSFYVLFYDDALRCIRSAMGHHHGAHDHRRRGPRKLRAVIGFLTQSKLRCVRWRLQCHEESPYNAVV